MLIVMETISASEYLRRERVFGEYEHERMVYNERGELIPITQLLEDFHHRKMLELTRKSHKYNHAAPVRRQWIQFSPLISA
jgi:hypothetical protein